MSPLVCVVVVNYNGREHLPYCLPSLAQTDYPDLRIIVVDNASTDGSVDLIPRLLPQALLIRNPTNRGWSGGNNVGITEALRLDAKYIALANTDIRVDPRWLKEAVVIAEASPRIGVLGFQVIEPIDHDKDMDAGFGEAMKRWDSTQLTYPKFVGGMAMMVRANLFRRLGLIDEAFFAYGEENDFQLRVGKAGYQIAAINAPVWHYGGGSFRRYQRRAEFLQTRNNIRLLIKHASLSASLRSGLRHFVMRCLRLQAPHCADPVERRLQSSGPLVNFAILVGATAVNLASLPAALRSRREHDRLAAQARAQLARELIDA